MVAVAALLLGGGVASASAVTYEGEFPELPGATIDLTVVKVDGKRFIDFVDTNAVPARCEGEDTFIGTGQPFDPPAGRVRGGEFKIVRSFPENNALLRLVGEIKPNGTAVGTFRHKADFSGAHGVCDTGLDDWIASR